MQKKQCFFILLLSFVLVCAVMASADSYSNVYGKTLARIRVRASASTSAEIIDNLIKGACVYMESSKTSGGTTFAKLRYRASDGSVQEGWCAQKVGNTVYIDPLSAREAKSIFSVSGGKLPSKKVGTFTHSTTKSSASSSSTSDDNLSVSAVKDIQKKLKALGFYSGSITGNIGTKTKSAICAFQKKYGLTANGVPGTKTISKLNSVYASSGKSSSSSGSSSSSSSSSSVNVKGTVYNLNWFKAKNNDIFKTIGLYRGYTATLQDLSTGRKLTVRIQSAGNHLDVEPRTASDTKQLCVIYGVSSASQITSDTKWQRRPMLLTTQTGFKFVCSMYGVPHGNQEITDNGFNGQFCLHFLNSKTHGSGKVDSGHMEAIAKAVEIVGASKVKKLEDL